MVKKPIVAQINKKPFRFSTKAGTLASLKGTLIEGTLCDQAVISVTDWLKDPQKVANDVLNSFPNSPLAIRSSCFAEDTNERSNAGAFRSLTNVPSQIGAINHAFKDVIAAYGKELVGQVVLVQPMVQNIALSGVVLTRDLDTGSPYYVINYDDTSGRTDTVTGGAESKTVYLHRSNKAALHSPRMQKIITATQELENITNSDLLDIEFCLTNDMELFILQVRPIAAHGQWKKIPDQKIDTVISSIRNEVISKMESVNGQAGQANIFGEMPDWNPAEMIGNSPRKLAYSLYQMLITDTTWATARAKMSYQNVQSPLMTSFGGRPYIDVRASLNSFLPADLEHSIANRLVNHQIGLLGKNTDLHDKIEFEIAITCCDFDFNSQKQQLLKAGFSPNEIEKLEDSLKKLTAKALNIGAEGLEVILRETDQIFDYDLKTGHSNPLQKSLKLFDGVIEHGILPFSILARHAFIGVSFLRSLIAQEILSIEIVEKFMRSVHTVASTVVNDIKAVDEGSLSKKEFLERHGHLRPGTYDILSKRYDQSIDLYLGHSGQKKESDNTPFNLSCKQEDAIDNAIKKTGYKVTSRGLMDYIRKAISSREEAKYAFSVGISNALERLAEWGAENNLSRDDLANLDIQKIITNSKSPSILKKAAQKGRKEHRLTRALRLPHLIIDPDDLYVVRPLRGQATFITNQSIVGAACNLDYDVIPIQERSIVLIKSADPGFDWIFSHNIAGLITQYGGPNSHMAIRCAEFCLPAAIGCGEKLYNQLLKAKVIELDCGSRKIEGRG